MIAIPPSCRVQAISRRFISEKYEILENYDLCPVPQYDKKKSETHDKLKYIEETTTNSTNQYYPESPVSIKKTGNFSLIRKFKFDILLLLYLLLSGFMIEFNSMPLHLNLLFL